jgi:hypothetical protein
MQPEPEIDLEAMPEQQEESRKIQADTELLPPAGTEGVGIGIAQMLEQIFSYRDEIRLAERCVRYYKLRRNEHWKYNNKDLNLLSANLLGSHHQKTCNMLTDNNPTFNAVPGGQLGENAQEQLSLLENVTDAWWVDTEQQSNFEESVHVGELYGTVAEQVFYDVNQNFPLGEIDTKTIDPLYVSLYPPKCRTVDEAEAILTWYPMSVRKARREWPEVAAKLVGDMSLLDDIGDDRDEDSNHIKKSTQSVISGITKWLTRSDKSASTTDDDDLFVVECWVKDYSTYDSGEPVYPGNIRRIRVANGGNVVLDDEFNPSLNPEIGPDLMMENYLFNRFPFSYIQPVTDPSSPFGYADFEQLEKLNIEFNKTMTQFAHFKDKTSRPKLLNPRDSGVTNQELDNMSGISNPTNHLVSQAIRYLDPPAMQADIMTGLNLYKDLFNEVAGSFNDVMQGQKAGSEVIAAKAIAMLLEEASRMARGKIRNYSKMLRERGRMFIALAQNWYDKPRYVSFQKQGHDEIQEVDRHALQIAGKINVVSGSTMPVSNIQRREEVLTLAQFGLVDQEYVLEKFNIDNYKDIIQRMQQGPIGQFVQKLGMIGIPQEILQLFQQIGQMDDKDVQRAIEQGQIPQFMQIVQQLMGQQQPPPPDPEMIKAQIEQQKMQLESQKMQMQMQADQQKAQIEQQKSQIDAQKVMAEIELIKAKIESEMIEQQVRAHGIDLDKQNIRIRKAEAVANIQAKQMHERANAVKTAEDVADKAERRSMEKTNTDEGGYSERGMVSNNMDM